MRSFALAIVLAAFASVLKGCFGGGKTATASHILVKEEAKCQELKAEIDAGADFAELARQHSKCPSGKRAGGSLGSFSEGSMVAAFDKIIFDPNTELGKVSDCVKTQFGYHLIKVVERDMKDKQQERKDEV
eukprot:TRINITY_DN37725_c0_g1_i1.p2 TRINITY_DN37725_c0_g1~~TRINITY_DN37725_c0_g1_i1.p2  ORF type:complete len:131 (+),score=36.74 TRINITY_DN37725_c0_g1_i1:40-432(+)